MSWRQCCLVILFGWPALACAGTGGASSLRLVPFPKEVKLAEGSFDLGQKLSLGVALLPKRCAQSELTRGLLKAVRVPELGSPRQVRFVFRRSGELSHAARAFLKVTRAVVKTH